MKRTSRTKAVGRAINKEIAPRRTSRAVSREIASRAVNRAASRVVNEEDNKAGKIDRETKR